MPNYQRRILVIEDNGFVRAAISEFLRRSGFHVFAAQTRQCALSLLRSNEIDLIVCDAVLPDGFGLELWEEMAARPPQPGFILTCGYPIASMSNLAFPQDMLLTKPYAAARLLPLIKRALALQAQATVPLVIPKPIENLPGHLL